MKFEGFSLMELRSEFSDILSKTIPSPEIFQPTFLEISGFPHYEEVISNWYAFFFTTSGNHSLKTLFINSLLDCIKDKLGTTNQLSFEVETAKVIRERMVKDKRIDLLIYDEAFQLEDDEIYRNAIIIENKINASLYNDLDCYFDNISVEQTKQGVVMSIKPVTIQCDGFINITHKYFIDKVSGNIGKYLVKANPKYLILLQELIQQLQTFSQTKDMKEYLEFYFENAVKINELIQIKENAFEEIVHGIKLKLEDSHFTFTRKYSDSLNIKYSENNLILLTIETGKIFTEGKFKIKLWLSGELAKKWNWTGLKTQLEQMKLKPADVRFNELSTGSQWATVAIEELSFPLTIETISNFPERLAEHINNVWEPFIAELINLLNDPILT